MGFRHESETLLHQWYHVLSSVLAYFAFIPFPAALSHVCEKLVGRFSDIGN